MASQSRGASGYCRMQGLEGAALLLLGQAPAPTAMTCEVEVLRKGVEGRNAEGVPGLPKSQSAVSHRAVNTKEERAVQAAGVSHSRVQRKPGLVL